MLGKCPSESKLNFLSSEAPLPQSSLFTRPHLYPPTLQTIDLTLTNLTHTASEASIRAAMPDIKHVVTIKPNLDFIS